MPSLDFDAIDVGDEPAPLRVTPTGEQVRRFAEAADMPGGRFLSDEAAKKEGLPGQIIPGNMSMALFARMLTSWADNVRLTRISATFRGLVHPNRELLLTGVVTEKDEDARTLECDLLLEGPEGERWVTGTATLAVGR